MKILLDTQAHGFQEIPAQGELTEDGKKTEQTRTAVLNGLAVVAAFYIGNEETHDKRVEAVTQFAKRVMGFMLDMERQKAEGAE